ncbi:MAG: 30S ribosomal protein S4 [bacterium]
MARYRDAQCRLCRREGEKLFLKGNRCVTDKCAFERRGYAPGQHGHDSRRKISDYGLQLREKQKARRIYGLLERQFKSYYEKAARQKGITGEALLRLLELRLDNVVYRLGFAPSRNAARQLVRHRHFTVNGRGVDIPSYQVKAGDVIRVKEKSRKLAAIQAALRRIDRRTELPWLQVDKATWTGHVLALPNRDEIPTPVQEHLIVGLYSK